MLLEREIYLDIEKDLEELEHFLEDINLKRPTALDYTIGIYEDNKLIATGSLSGNIIKGVGVSPEYQGKSISSKIITNLLNKAIELSRENIFIYTSSDSERMFLGLGFKRIAKALPYAVLLEWGGYLDKYVSKLKKISKDKPLNAACIVINANPFTLGHRYLIEKAAQESEFLYIIVVEEDRSLFSFSERLRLVKEGTEDMENLEIISSGEYIISAATFPSYFTKESNLAMIQASLDLDLFSNHIAPSLNITKRFIGEEPFSEITSMYNETMKKILPKNGIKVIEIPRLEVGNAIISASRVRRAMEEGKLDDIKNIVSSSTYDYLKSCE